ncbi:MAG: tetratricopeptide repeat protein, partial [Candidatus Gastranaerophilales bacterium]|nr:tetratricopeptide repeat protein [Candidatus Gastranaerophilales bacterium]
ELSYISQKALTESNIKIEQLESQKTTLEQVIASKERELQNLAQKSERNELQDLLALYKNKIENLSGRLVSVNSELSKTKENLVLLQNKDKLLALENLELKKKEASPAKAIPNTDTAYQEVCMKAIQYLKEDKPNSAIFYFNLGKSYCDKKNYSKAIENYNLALVNNPDYKNAYRELGFVYAQTGDYTNSVRNLKNYLKFSNNIKEQELVRQFISKLEKAG